MKARSRLIPEFKVSADNHGVWTESHKGSAYNRDRFYHVGNPNVLEAPVCIRKWWHGRRTPLINPLTPQLNPSCPNVTELT